MDVRNIFIADKRQIVISLEDLQFLRLQEDFKYFKIIFYQFSTIIYVINIILISPVIAPNTYMMSMRSILQC